MENLKTECDQNQHLTVSCVCLSVPKTWQQTDDSCANIKGGNFKKADLEMNLEKNKWDAIIYGDASSSKSYTPF